MNIFVAKLSVLEAEKMDMHKDLNDFEEEQAVMIR